MGMRPRNAIVLAALTLTLAAFIACLMNFIIPGIYGFSTTPTMRGNYDLQGRITTFWNAPSPHPLTEVVPWLTTGFVFVVIMKLLQARFLWIPDPTMAIVAWDWVGGLHGTWAAASICAILKWTLLRIGGSKLYSEKVVPLVGGFIPGDALNALIAGTVAFTSFRPV